MNQSILFQPFEIQDRPILLPYLRKKSQTCDRTFTNLFCWQHHYRTQWAEVDGWLIVRAHINGERKAAYIALSQEDNPHYSEIIPLLEADATQNDQPLTLMGLNDDECELIEQQFPGSFVFDRNRDFADYIYKADNLRTLKGRKYAQKRNHVNKYTTLYTYHYEPITRENIADCLKLEEAWIAQHDHDESARAEYDTICRAFQYFDELELMGGALYVDDQIAAFTYGSAVNDYIFCTHVEKGDIRYEGIYQMINHLFAQHIPERYDRLRQAGVGSQVATRQVIAQHREGNVSDSIDRTPGKVGQKKRPRPFFQQGRIPFLLPPEISFHGKQITRDDKKERNGKRSHDP